MNKSALRVLFFIIVLITVVTLPWWLSAILLVGLTIYFPLYIEVLFFGFLFDTLYSAGLTFPYTALTIAFIFLMIVFFIKTQIRT